MQLSKAQRENLVYKQQIEEEEGEEEFKETHARADKPLDLAEELGESEEYEGYYENAEEEDEVDEN